MYNKPMRTFRRETALFLLALLIGLAVRLVGLGAHPLSDPEAAQALQALDASNGIRTTLGSNTAYVALTSALFFAFGGASNALARLIPALAGSALILVPMLFREQIKPRPAVILSFALALEPGLTALSRQAGSPILALTFTMAAWGFWMSRRLPWAGVCGRTGADLRTCLVAWLAWIGYHMGAPAPPPGEGRVGSEVWTSGHGRGEPRMDHHRSVCHWLDPGGGDDIHDDSGRTQRVDRQPA